MNHLVLGRVFINRWRRNYPGDFGSGSERKKIARTSLRLMQVSPSTLLFPILYFISQIVCKSLSMLVTPRPRLLGELSCTTIFIMQIKFQEMAMEATKMRGLYVSTRERWRVLGLNPLFLSVILRTHIDFPCCGLILL